MLKKPLFWVAAVVLIGLVGYQYYSSPTPNDTVDDQGGPIRIKCLAAGPGPYWKLVIAGAEDAAKKFNADLDTIIPESTSSAIPEQTAALSQINYDKIDGLMISPLDPANQTRLISEAAASTFVVTIDNEVPDALAHYHVGADNRTGGRLLADLVRRAVPDGGEIAIFVGDNSRETAQTRRQVLINTLAQRDEFASVSDELEDPIEAGRYTVVATYLDHRDTEKAKENAAAALRDHPNLKCLVGLYSQNGPACAEAVAEIESADDVKVIAFDQLKETLDGIREGTIFATVVQDQYTYGFEGVRLLCYLQRNKVEGTPSKFSGHVTVTCRAVDSDNLDEYESELKSQSGA